MCRNSWSKHPLQHSGCIHRPRHGRWLAIAVKNTALLMTLMVAGSPLDFIPTSRLLTFEPYSSRMCITIDIVDDAAVENTESFTVSLSRTGGLDSRVQLRQLTSTIEITDDDTGMKFICSVY